MKKNHFLSGTKRKSIAAIVASLFALHAYGADPVVTENLTLENAVRLAIKNAPSMIMESIKVDLAKADEQEAGDHFDLTWKASAAVDNVRGYQYPTELQQFPADLTQAAVDMSNYNTNVLGLPPTVAPAITPPALSTFMTDHQNNTEFKNSLTKLFRSGIYTDLSIVLQSSKSDKLHSDLAQIPPLLSSGIPGFMVARKPGATLNDYAVVHPSLIQMTINFPLLKFRGENNIATANERYKRYLRESAEMTLKYSVASIIQNVVNNYWDYKAALTRLQYTEESEAQVARWLGKLDKSKSAKSAEIAHLSGFATQLKGDVTKAKEAVNLSRNALAQALGISPDDARKIMYAQDTFPLDWSGVLDSFNDAATRTKWNAMAEQNRFDLKAASLQLDAANTIFEGSKNDVLPKLDLAFILRQQGLSANDSSAIDLDSLSDGQSKLGGAVQLSFEMKFDNSKAKAQVTRTRYLKLQKESEYGNAKRTVGLDVDSAVSSVRNSLVGLQTAKDQSSHYVRALGTLVKNDTIESGKVFDLVVIEQARLKAFVDNVTAIQNVANAVAAAHFRTGKLLTQKDGVQEVAINDITKLP